MSALVPQYCENLKLLTNRNKKFITPEFFESSITDYLWPLLVTSFKPTYSLLGKNLQKNWPSKICRNNRSDVIKVSKVQRDRIFFIVPGRPGTKSISILYIKSRKSF